MKRIRQYALCLGAMVVMAACKPAAVPQQTEQECGETCTQKVNTPDDAVKALLDGNGRFVAGKSLHPRSGCDRVAETAPHQAPFAAVVGCSDSRVPVELLFDQGIGDIFVIRTAGNNVNSASVMGSVDYAADHLGVKAIIVLGHGSCGGVTGAISTEEHHGKVGELLNTIRQDVAHYVGKPDSLDVAIRHHAAIQVERIMQMPHVAQKVKSGELFVGCAYYDVKTGKVEMEPQK